MDTQPVSSLGVIINLSFHDYLCTSVLWTFILRKYLKVGFLVYGYVYAQFKRNCILHPTLYESSLRTTSSHFGIVNLFNFSYSGELVL